MDFPLPLRRVLVIVVAALGVGAVGLGIGALRNTAPTEVRQVGQPPAAAGQTSQPGADLQAMLSSAAKPASPAGSPLVPTASPAASPTPQSTARLPAGSPPGGGEPASSTARRTIKVYVTGAVRRAGVYSLPPEARIDDALKAAGGPARSADMEAINLADFLKDGDQVHFPRRGEVARKTASKLAEATPSRPAGRIPGHPPAGSAAAGDGAPSAGGHSARTTKASELAARVATEGKVDLNSATAEELETLPGVGPATAQAIIAHRTENGRFLRIEDLMQVRGIREKRFAKLKDYITVR